MRTTVHRRRTRAPIARATALVLALTTALALTACGGVGGPGTDPPPDGDPIADVLDALGVDTAPSARRAPDGSALGADAAPLGAAASYGEPAAFSDESGANPTMELVIARNFFASDTLLVQQLDGVAVTPVGAIEFGSETVLGDLSAGNEGWVAPQYGDENQFQSLRDVAAGDLDGDGFDEVAAVFVDPADGVLKLRTFDDDAAGYAPRTTSLAAGAAIRSVKLTALDDDGDGRATLVVALAYDDRVELHPVDPSSASPALGTATSLPQELDGSRLYVRLAVGQLDYDNGLELAVVVNEVIGSASAIAGVANLYVFDDADADRVERLRREVRATVGGPVAAEAADVALADIDGDGLAEVVLAGATNLAWGCDDLFSALMLAFDDAAAGFAQLGASVAPLSYQNCPAYASWKRFFVFVATPDLDGDGVHEIAANQLVFEDFADAAPFTLMDGVALP